MADEDRRPAQDEADPADDTSELKRLEEADEVPSDPREWPDGKAKFETFAVDDDAPYGEGPTAKIGPGTVEHHEDGSVTVEGEKVDNPDDFKGEPIPGGPTDPNAPKLAGERDRAGGDPDEQRLASQD